MAAYYNEIDKFAAAWLRELIKAGQIADGEVDERSIEDIVPSDLRNFTQCHFFAGIGVWSYALKRAGWPDDRPVWTGSCPCQPFSTAGKRKGAADERHLWPALFHLIQHGKPKDVPVFGEQVASKDGLAWLDLVQADLEAANHSFWPFDLCAAGFGAPHIRQRLYFMANTTGTGRAWRVRGDSSEAPGIGRLCVTGGESSTSDVANPQLNRNLRGCGNSSGSEATPEERGQASGFDEVGNHGSTDLMANAGCSHGKWWSSKQRPISKNTSEWDKKAIHNKRSGTVSLVAISASDRCDQGQPESEEQRRIADAVRPGSTGYVANTTSERRQPGRGWISQQGQPSEDAAAYSETGELANTGRAEDNQQGNAGSTEQSSYGTDNGIPCGSGGELRPATGELADAGSSRSQGNGLQPIFRGGPGLQPERGASGSGTAFELGQPFGSGLEGLTGAKPYRSEPGRDYEIAGGSTTQADSTCGNREANGPTNGFWRDADWLWCRDEKYRPVEPGSFPLAHGSPNRVGRLRGYGNAIVAAQAQVFIESCLETIVA